MRKPRAGTATKEQVIVRKKVLGSKPSSELDPMEEKALRMRHGIGLDPDAPLPSKTDGHPDAAQKLLEMEAQLLRAMRKRSEVEVREDEEIEQTQRRRRPVESRVKSKIVRALRKKS